ncbi:MAG: 3-phosphoshikimate 1-carboxyvinyltransferase [Clostridia bacterium]|nr:3-phosphoshikimate 1-carboxyvinyltransferase [Clostridia bacterium]
MNAVIAPGARTGTVTPPASKSHAHRLFIAAAFSDGPKTVVCRETSKDIEATIGCLEALGAEIVDKGDGLFSVLPAGLHAFSGSGRPCVADLYCGESGSTQRFMLPLAGITGRPCVFYMEGRLPERPLDVFADVLRARGMHIAREKDTLLVSGKLTAGDYELPGNVSSQFISGLLLALPLIKKEKEEAVSRVLVRGKIESGSYIGITESVLLKGGIRFTRTDTDGLRVYEIPAGQTYRLPDVSEVEKDWSGAAYFLAAGAFSKKGVTVKGLDPGSPQGDRRIIDILKRFGASVTVKKRRGGTADFTVKKGKLKGVEVDASDIPDLVPLICAVAAGAQGDTVITNAGRLRLKESDRIKTTAAMINSLGGNAEETADGLVIHGEGFLKGGPFPTADDHRIAMAGALAASIAKESVYAESASCTGKSYPGFWDDLFSLKTGG